MNRIPRILFACSAALLHGVTAGAASGEQSAIEVITVTGYKLQRSLSEVANTITVIDDERIRRELSNDIKDLVRYEPGISVNNEAGRFGLGGFNIRGIEANRIAMELDGVPVIEGFAIGDFSNSGRNLVDTGLLKSVEILRGPASALFGSDAMGGVVAYTTLDPADFLRDADRYAGLQSAYTGVDDGRRIGASAAFAQGPFSALAFYTGRRGNERDNALTAPNPRDYSADNLLVKLLYESPDGPSNELVVDVSFADIQTDIRSLIHGPGRYATTTALSGDDTDQRYRASFEQSWQEGIGAWSDQLIWRVYWQASAVSQRTAQSLAPAPPRTPYATERRRRFDYDQDSIGGEMTAEKTLQFGRFSHRVVYGIEAMHSVIAELRDGLLTNLSSGATTKTILGEVFPLRDFPESATMELGLYSQDEIELTETLTLIPALRVEYYSLAADPDPIFTEDNPATAIAGIEQASLSPKVGILYRPNPAHTLFAQYARGFRSPPFDDVNIGFTIPQFGYTAIPNPDLEPETSDGFEFGWRYDTEAVNLDLALFLNLYENFIESRVNLGLDPLTGLLIFQSQNRATAEIYGAEVRSSFRLGDFFAALEGLLLNLGGAWQYGQDTERDEPLNTIDPLKAVVGLRYEPPSGRWGLELVATLADGKSPGRVDMSRVQLFTVPSSQIVDLLGFVDLHERIQLNWGIRNLLDEAYWEWADVRGVPAGDPNIPLHARPGRNFSVSLDLSWR